MMETSSARAALEKMTDQELIKAFLDLGPQFSELEKMFLDVENKRIINAGKESVKKFDQSRDGQVATEEKTSLKLEAIDHQMSGETKTIPKLEAREDQISCEKKNSLKVEERGGNPLSNNKSKYPDYNFEDPTIPAGWCSKLINNGPGKGFRKVFRSPGGKLFLTRKGALQFMLEEKCFPEADVDLMKSHCIYKMKTSTDKPPKTLPTYNVSKQEEYNTSDPTLPKGWSSKFLRNGVKRAPKKLIRSPQGQVFISRKKALEYMMQHSEKYSKYEIEKMKEHCYPCVSVSIRERSSPADVKEDKTEVLHNEKDKSEVSDKNKDRLAAKGWLSDPMLPPGWLYIHVVKNEVSRKSGLKRVLKFKTVEGDEIESFWKALKFMRSNASYSNCEIESFISFNRMKNKSEQEECLEEAKKGKVGNEDKPEDSVPVKTDSISIETSARKTSHGGDNSRRYSSHPLLPTGWLLARYELAKGGILMRFKSPAGVKIHSKKKVLEIMKSQGYSRIEMENVQKITSVMTSEDDAASRQDLQSVEPSEETEGTLEKVIISEVKTDESLEFSLISENKLDTSDDLTLDEEAILNLTEDDFEIVGHTYSEDEDSIAVSEETDQTFSEVTVSQSHSEENPDCDESLEGENASLGPKISFSLEAFHILSEAFYENRTISEDETSSLSDLICAPQKDVKWFFLKLRHLVLEKNIEDHKDQISELLESLTQTPGGIDLITI